MSKTDVLTGHSTGTSQGVVRLVHIPMGDRTLRLRLHLEGENPYGSVKYRTAQALLASLEQAGTLCRGGHVVESTSGNLGIALAGLCTERGYRCTLAVDDNTCPFSLRLMSDLGAELIHVGGTGTKYAVGARIQVVRSFLADNPQACWTNQYNNPANPAVHSRTTGPSLLHCDQLPHPDAVAVPVSTGGTLAGSAAYVRSHDPAVKILAVDAVGSATTGHTAGLRPHKLPGFGSGLRSVFLNPDHTDRTLDISDTDAALACLVVRYRTGIALGGSAGAVVLAAVHSALDSPGIADVACLCPDGGDRYRDTIYSPDRQSPSPDRPGDNPDVSALYALRL